MSYSASIVITNVLLLVALYRLLSVYNLTKQDKKVKKKEHASSFEKQLLSPPITSVSNFIPFGFQVKRAKTTLGDRGLC